MSDILSGDVIKEWGLESLPKTKQMDIVDRIGKMMYQAILLRSLDILPEKDQVEFDLLLEEKTTTPENVIAFLQSKIPTFEKLIEEEKNSLKESFLISVS